jgi:hypothetical protein
MGTSEMYILYLLFGGVIIFVIWFLSKDLIDKIGVDDGTLVEDKLDKNVIPTTRNWGLWGSIISGAITLLSGDVISGIVIIIIGVSSTLGFVILLEGFSTIIKLLRKISEK